MFFLQIFFLTSCNLLKDNNILAPLNLSSEEFKIYNTLKESTYFKSNIILKIPNSKEKKSAINFLNNNLAVLFYTTKEKKEIQMAAFFKKNNQWNYFLDIPLKGSSLDTVLINKDEKTNLNFLIIGTIKNSEKICNIYSFNSNSFKKIYSFTYHQLFIHDVDSDGVKEVVAFCDIPKDFNKNKYKVLAEESFKEKAKEEKEVAINTRSYKNLKKENLNCILVFNLLKDGIKLKNIKQTFIFHRDNMEILEHKFDTNTLKCMSLFLNTKFIVDPLKKQLYILKFKKNEIEICLPCYKIPNNIIDSMSPITFKDINNDNKLEVILSKPFVGYSYGEILANNTYSTPIPYITYWLNPKDETQKSVSKHIKIINCEKNEEFKETYVDYNHNFGIKLPKRWKKKVSAKCKNDNIVEFFVFKNSLEQDSEKILSITVDYSINKEKMEKGFFVLKEKDSIIYTANLFENLKISDPSLKISKKELEKMFFMLN